ncbi:MAG TPA: Nif11-like leader peptide family RiPP precursor [Kamptonema sp.]|nr:Nif11-like leader peptide family RiPP precursor [Kamptonema sp.]
MSKESVLEFIQKVSTDSALETEIEQAVTGKSEQDAATNIVQIASQHGYSFTSDEILAQRQEMQELSEEDLEQVAGGSLGGSVRSAYRWTTRGW